MTLTMDPLLAEVARSHFPHPPATPEQLAAFEATIGWRLDDELRAFYLRCDGAELFRPLPDANYSFLSLAEILQTTARLRKRDDSASTASWFPLVDCQDSDFVLVDVARLGGPYPLLDAYHETYPLEVQQIAASFGEFLERALASNNRFFWLGE